MLTATRHGAAKWEGIADKHNANDKDKPEMPLESGRSVGVCGRAKDGVKHNKHSLNKKQSNESGFVLRHF